MKYTQRTLPTDKRRNTKSRRKQKKKSQKKSWYDETCYEVSKRLKLVAKLLANSPRDPHLRGSFEKTRKEYKRLLKLKKQEWRNSLIKKLESMETNDPKEYWKMVNELRAKKQSETPTLNTEDFVNFFEKLYSKNVPKDHDEKEKFVNEHLEKLDFQKEPDFAFEELLKAIQLLKKNKACGKNRIPAEVLKATPVNLLMVILKLMNKIKNTCQYPKKWAVGIMSLILKEGDSDDPNNYRAITLINSIAKVLALMMNKRIEKWCDECNIIRKEQIGFEKLSRPADHLFVAKTIIDSYSNQNQKIYACFVDFRKAYDSVWRTGLFYKLIKNNMSLNLIKLIHNMYEKTSNHLKVNGGISRVFRTYQGVQQGDILSPKLFNIFINDIPLIFDESCEPPKLGDEKINCLMYADDLVMFSESAIGIQNCLNRLKEYTVKWGLEINKKKTKVMIFQKSGTRPKLNFKFGDIPIDVTDRYKYLGTTLFHSGHFKTNQNLAKKKGLRAAYLILNNIATSSKVSTSIKIFEKVVEPILLYNCEITEAFIPDKWNYEKFLSKMWDSCSELNTVVLSFLRQILGVHKKTTNLGLLAETGKFPICLKVFSYIMKYWMRVSTTSKSMLKQAFLVNCTENDNGNRSWMKIVNFLKILTHADESIASSKDIERKAKVFKSKLFLKYIDWWKSQAVVTGENKLDFFYKYKKTFKFESYLDNIPKNLRRGITKLRLSCHAFPVETLRYSKENIKRKDRLCKVCNLNEVGDEEHYMKKCKNILIERTRSAFIKDIKEKFTTMVDFSSDNIIEYCLIMNDTRFQLPMAIYTKEIMDIFSEINGLQPRLTCPQKTRCGRQTKRPEKLDL
jgi:hypothetical protein